MNNQIKEIVIGSDHGGLRLKNEIKTYLENKGIKVTDVGTYTDESCHYPEYANKVTEQILSGKFQKGILVCGTGQGMAMCANKHKGIRAVVCSDTFSAHASREHNNSNVLCLGQRVVGTNLAFDIIESWMNANYEGGRHQKRIDMFDIEI